MTFAQIESIHIGGLNIPKKPQNGARFHGNQQKSTKWSKKMPSRRPKYLKLEK